MDRENARQEIRQRISCTEYLTKSKSGLYCCPYCGSGNGTNGTGALKLYETNTWTCHACNKSGDVIDLYQLITGTGYNEALYLMADEIGIAIDTYTPAVAAHNSPKYRLKRPQNGEGGKGNMDMPLNNKTHENGDKMPIRAGADYTAYYRECRKRLNDPAAVAYLNSRGISLATADAYWIGYDPAADPAGAPGAMGEEYKAHPCQRLIIPTSPAHYVGRRIDGKREFDKINAKGSSPDIFNSRALYAQGVQEVFIVEGAFDALSIMEAGYSAIALNSAGNYDALVKKLEQRRTVATLILCPDNDRNPQTAEQVKKNFATLAAGLQRLNISHITADINGEYKDANEHLQGNKGAFLDALERAQRQTAAKPDNTSYYIDNIMTAEIDRFKSVKNTGFENLDKQAGGLYSGLYAVAAISSLGKTTFCHQIADQLAAAGNDVLFFSLEQSRLELVSKSLARRTAQANMETAVTSLSIRRGYLPKQVTDAAERYKQEVQENISIIEGNFACNISFIGEYVRQYIRRNDTRPVVFIDYLQILQPEQQNGRQQTTKEMVDSSITELKRISRELDLTVFVVCSVNRANYLTPVDFESLKESGGIEYTCDVIWGLQLQCLNDPLFDKQNNIKERREKIKAAKAADPRKIELVCLKNRYGIANYSCYFDYYPAYDLFTECSEADVEFTPDPPQRKAGRKL